MSTSPDVLILGGGVIGCSIAYELSKARAAVTLVERGNIGQESSSAAAGMLYPLMEEQKSDFFDFCVRARSLFPDYLHELRDRTGQDVEWHQDGGSQVALSEEEAFSLRECYPRYLQAGVNVRLLAQREVRELEPHLGRFFEPALYFPDAAHLDNAHYTQALAQAALDCGAEVRVHEQADRILVQDERVYGIQTSRGEIHAGHVINCMGAWAPDLTPSSDIRIPVIPVRGQMLSLKTASPFVRRLIFSRDCYLVPRKNNEIFVGATAEWAGYDKRNTADAIQKLLAGALELVPDLQSATFARVWSGLRPGTPDSLPILGEDPVFKGLIYATGHFRNGILLSALTGKLIAELVVENRTSMPLSHFSPARFIGAYKTPNPAIE